MFVIQLEDGRFGAEVNSRVHLAITDNLFKAKFFTDSELANLRAIKQDWKNYNILEVEIKIKGEYKLIDPFSSRSYISFEQKGLIIKALQKEGYGFSPQSGDHHNYNPEFISW